MAALQAPVDKRHDSRPKVQDDVVCSRFCHLGGPVVQWLAQTGSRGEVGIAALGLVARRSSLPSGHEDLGAEDVAKHLIFDSGGSDAVEKIAAESTHIGIRLLREAVGWRRVRRSPTRWRGEDLLPPRVHLEAYVAEPGSRPPKSITRKAMGWSQVDDQGQKTVHKLEGGRNHVDRIP